MLSEIEAQDVVVVKAATAKDRVFYPLAVNHVVLAIPILLFLLLRQAAFWSVAAPLEVSGRHNRAK